MNGFFGIFENFSDFGEVKRGSKKESKHIEKKKSCESEKSKKNECKKPAQRKASVSHCSDESKSAKSKCDNKKKWNESDSEGSGSDNESECSGKTDKTNKRRKLAQCICKGGKCKRPLPKIMAQTRIHTNIPTSELLKAQKDMQLAESGNVFTGWFDKIFGGDKKNKEAEPAVPKQANATAAAHLAQLRENEPLTTADAKTIEEQE